MSEHADTVKTPANEGLMQAVTEEQLRSGPRSPGGGATCGASVEVALLEEDAAVAARETGLVCGRSSKSIRNLTQSSPAVTPADTGSRGPSIRLVF